MDRTQHTTQWRQRFFSSTRGQIVSLLRQTEHTVNELARHLEMTDNAIRGHLAALERDGLIERASDRRGQGKPSFTYTVTSEAEQLFPKAYSLALTSLLAALEDRLDEQTRLDILVDAGQRLAGPVLSAGMSNFDQRAQFAARMLTEFGGLATFEQHDGGGCIKGNACPLLDTAAERPEICQLAAAFVQTLVGAPVTVCCQYGDKPRCSFEISSMATTP